MGIKSVKEKFDEIENIAIDTLSIMKVVRESCEYNDYWNQEFVLSRAIELHEEMLDRMEEVGFGLTDCRNNKI